MYQNNNNRIVPDEVKNTTLQPQASPVDKLIKYQPDLTEVNKTKANMDALIQLGKGVISYDSILQKHAQNTAIDAYEKTEAVNNKKEWADVSKNIKGMAKFNPYLKDSYRNLVAQDIYRTGVLKINSNPNLHKMSNTEFDNFIQQTKNEMAEAFTEAHLNPKHYADLLEKFSQNCYQTSVAYVQKNSEYNYKNTLTIQGNDLAFQAGANTYNLPTDLEKSQALINTINQKVEECVALGIPKDDIANSVISTGLQSYIVENADTISTAALEAALQHVEIDGTPIKDIVPNFNFTLHQMIRQAKRASYEDRKADYDNEKLTLKINSDMATKDFFSWFKNNQNASPDEIQAQALALIDQYEIDEDGIGFLQNVAHTKGLMTSLKQVTSDSSVLTELGRKAALGTLTGEEVANAVNNGTLSWEDGLKFSDRINREAAQNVKQLEHDFNDFNKQLDKSGIYGQSLRGSKELQTLKDAANQIIVDVDTGELTPDKAKEKLNELKRKAAAIHKIKTNRNKNVSLLTNANYINNQPLPTYSFGTASDAFKNLGYIRGGFGQRIAGNITSGINPNRTIDGVTKPHRGYDLGAKEGTAIKNCNMQGKVVDSGYEKTMGNYVIIQYENGTFARFLHLKYSTTNMKGQTILPNQGIGFVGNTGHSTGAHLHVDFWNKNYELINVETFAKGIK